MAEHLFKQTGKDFRWPKGSPNKSISITVSPEETAELMEEINRFLTEGLPEALRKAAKRTARSAVRQIVRRWEDQCEDILQDEWNFRTGIAYRWGDAIDLLRVLKMSAMEVGDAFLRRDRRRKSPKNRLRNGVLIRLHARACQVTGEIIALLEAGYADGAFARWRTLHEITVVAFLIADHGDPLAERYLAHEAVEHEKTARAFEKVHKALGQRPITKRDRKDIRAAFDDALAKYGRGFEEQYGWADMLRDGKRCTFDDLERLAGRSALRLHYKLASNTVHASQRAIRHNLGGPGDHDVILAGPSNAGLEEAGSQAAYTLTALTSLLVSAKVSIKQMVEMETLVILRNRASKAFMQTACDLDWEAGQDRGEV
ncbi:DUF5677 domain-containing protein [uncultured Brevundimonas sp.]|uniref:DUF5677 domain-containing protein n=1 Tax=uncultured Brevundimonas sp. TaxID=213418 RepID=UPI0025E5DAD0|nr:DUF5677 domain-containing protein [uncultured Brevundimonas sp.]